MGYRNGTVYLAGVEVAFLKVLKLFIIIVGVHRSRIIGLPSEIIPRIRVWKLRRQLPNKVAPRSQIEAVIHFSKWEQTVIGARSPIANSQKKLSIIFWQS